MRFAPVVFASIIAGGSSLALAQLPPFNGGGVVAYDPEISVVNSGALLDAEVVVSHDRKYVTINARPSLSRLQALNVFPVANAGTPVGTGGDNFGGAQLGFVGGAGFIDDETEGAAATSNQSKTAPPTPSAKKPGPVPQMPVQSSPSQILKVDPTASNSVLRREGMHRIETE